MKHLVTILFLLTATTLVAQTAADANKVKQTLKGAGITQPIIKTKAVFLSDNKKQDTIILTVPSGLISQSNSTLRIKTADNSMIYTESFKTAWFVHGIFQPATMPKGGEAGYESGVNKYIASLTKAQFEAYAKQKINTFLKEVEVSGAAVKRAKLYGKITDQALYNTVTTNPNVKAIWFPCFTCEEDGARFFTWSAPKAQVVKVLETN